MQEFLPLLRTLVISLLLTAGALALLSRPLAGLVLRLTPDARTVFWVRYSQIILAAVPSVAALVVDAWTTRLPPVAAVRFTVAAALIGVIIAVSAIGGRVMALTSPPKGAPADLPASPGAAPRAERMLGS